MDDEEPPARKALTTCYDKLVSGMVSNDVLPKLVARHFVTEHERQDISKAPLPMDANEKLLSAVRRQGDKVVVYLCRVLFEVKLRELGWRLYYALTEHSVDVSEINQLFRLGHFSHPLQVIVLPNLDVELATLLTRIQSACEEKPFSAIRRFTITILCSYRLLHDRSEMESIKSIDTLFDILSMYLKWHWYDPLLQIVSFLDRRDLKAQLEDFGALVKSSAEKKLSECASVVQSLNRLPPQGDLLEAVVGVDPEAAQVQDILRNQDFLKKLGVSASLFVGEKNSRTTLFWWIPRAATARLMTTVVGAVGEMERWGVLELRVSGFFRIVASTRTFTFYESKSSLDVDDVTFFQSILEDREAELRVAQQSLHAMRNKDMSSEMKVKQQRNASELTMASQLLKRTQLQLSTSEQERKSLEGANTQLVQEKKLLQERIEELSEQCSKRKTASHEGEGEEPVLQSGPTAGDPTPLSQDQNA